MTVKTRKFFHRIAIAAVCIAILSYTVFHMISLFSGELSTVVVRSATEETRLEFDGYIFRDEKVVFSSYQGAIDYKVADGLKLSAGQAYATVYERGNNANISDLIGQIDRRIAVLEEATSSGKSLHDLPSINEDIANEYLGIVKRLADGDMRGISENIDGMTAQLGQVSMLTNEKSPLKATLEALYGERERIKGADGESIQLKADKSGYFYSNVDGYENTFTLDAAYSMTPDKYHEYSSSIAEAYTEGTPVGKMVYSSDWAFVTMVSTEYSKHFEEGRSYVTSFMKSENIDIPLTLAKKVVDRASNSVLMIFQCDRMPSGFDFARSQSVQVIVSSITGINVPKSVTHRSDGSYYVYILKGSVVFERKLDIIYEGSDYYTVRDGVEDDGDDIYLQSNDNLILNGNNLFDGRILE